MFGEAVATVIHRDAGATNGVVHVIDKLLFVNDDLTRNITGLEEPFNGWKKNPHKITRWCNGYK